MDDQCREWQGSRNDRGYGRVKCGDRYMLVHQVVWIGANGPIPEGKILLHYCDNPPCFRLDHLRLGTHADNASDRELAGHVVRNMGELNGNAKLTTEKVLEIRRLYLEEGWVQQRIADRFGIAQPQVSLLVRGKSWGHLSSS